MTTFETKMPLLSSLLTEITEGKIQLPDFQRGWVWNDDHIRDLLVSIARSFRKRRLRPGFSSRRSPPAREVLLRRSSLCPCAR